MNALSQEISIDAEPSAETDCLAFVSDNQTFGVVSMVAEQYFESSTVRDGGVKNALEDLAHESPTVAIVDLSDSSDPLTDALMLTSSFGESLYLIGVGTTNDINLYRDLIEAGLSDYLVKPVTEKSLALALENLQKPVAEPELTASKPQKTQRVVVIGARGGVGASTVSTSLAWILAEEYGHRTSLVDLDLEFGTVALALDLEPTHGLREALENPARLDSLFVSSAIAKVSDKLSVLATEETMSWDAELNPSAIEILFDTLARNNDFIVVDLPRSALAFRNRVLRAADQILVVTDLNLASLRDSIRILAMIEDVAPEKSVTVIANRTGRKEDGMSKTDFQRTLNRNIDILVPEDRKATKMAADSGKPLPVIAKASKPVVAMREIAENVSPTKPKKAKKFDWKFFAKTKKDEAE